MTSAVYLYYSCTTRSRRVALVFILGWGSQYSFVLLLGDAGDDIPRWETMRGTLMGSLCKCSWAIAVYWD
jgi:hypothetical protein